MADIYTNNILRKSLQIQQKSGSYTHLPINLSQKGQKDECETHRVRENYKSNHTVVLERLNRRHDKILDLNKKLIKDKLITHIYL